MNLESRIILCGNKKNLVNDITGYVQDTVTYLAVLKYEKKWAYMIFECFEEENEEIIKELNKIDELCVIMNGYEMGNTSKLSISRYITYFRNQYKKNIIEENEKKSNGKPYVTDLAEESLNYNLIEKIDKMTIAQFKNKNYFCIYKSTADGLIDETFPVFNLSWRTKENALKFFNENVKNVKLIENTDFILS